MLVRRIRNRKAGDLADRVRTSIRGKLLGSPKVEVNLAVASTEDISAFIAAWNGAKTRCAKAGWGKPLEGQTVLLRDSGRLATLKGEALLVNILKFAKNPVAADILAHEFGRRLWSQKLSSDQKKTWETAWSLLKTKKSAEDGFAEVFRMLASGKAMSERWSAFRL